MFKREDQRKLLTYLSKQQSTPKPNYEVQQSPIISSSHIDRKDHNHHRKILHPQQQSQQLWSNSTAKVALTSKVEKVKSKRAKPFFLSRTVDESTCRRKNDDSFQSSHNDDTISQQQQLIATNAFTFQVPNKKKKKNQKQAKNNQSVQEKISANQDKERGLMVLSNAEVGKHNQNKCKRNKQNIQATVSTQLRKRTRQPTGEQQPKENAKDNEAQLIQDVQNMLSQLHRDVGHDDETFEQIRADVEQRQDLVEQSKQSKKQKTNHNIDDLSEERSLQLGQRARQTLASSMFRSLNEYLYSHRSDETRQTFTANKFRLYHQAYEKLMAEWPLKPIDYLIDIIKKRMAKSKLTNATLADVGCGSRPQLAEAFPTATVHSFDLYQSDPSDLRIVAADMARLPLDNAQCDYAVYSLSMMATNLREVIREANRILKPGGYLLIVEVTSRFVDYKGVGRTAIIVEKHVGHRFATDMRAFGFQLTAHEELPPNGYFIFFCFKKNTDIEQMGPKSKLPQMTLKACVYKSR